MIGQNEILTFGVLRGFAGTAPATSTAVWVQELIRKDSAQYLERKESLTTSVAVAFSS